MRGLALALAALVAGCGKTAPTCESRPDPTARVAAEAVEAAADAATFVDVTIGGLVNWRYAGEDPDEATLEAFRSVFAALDEPPWDECVEYEATSFTSMNTTFGSCAATDSTPAVSGTVHVFFETQAGITLQAQLAASGVEIGGSNLDLLALFDWDPTPEAAGLRSQGLTATVRLPSGDSVSVAGQVGLDADPTCQAIAGDLATLGPPGTLTVVDFEQCLGECPSAGGQIFYDGDGGVVEIDFDGSETAIAHAPCGDFQVPLDCE